MYLSRIWLFFSGIWPFLRVDLAFFAYDYLATLLKGAEAQATPSLAQINFFKVCMKNELCYVKQHLWRYEYDYKCDRYSLVTTVAVKHLHVTTLKRILLFLT